MDNKVNISPPFQGFFEFSPVLPITPIFPSDEQWQLVQPLFPPPPVLGRPSRHPRILLTAIAWKLITASPWYHLPPAFPPRQTLVRHYQAWLRTRLWDNLIATLTNDLDERGHIHLPSAISDRIIALTLKENNCTLTFPPALLSTWQLPTILLIIQHLAHRLAHPTNPLDPGLAFQSASEPNLILATRIHSR